MLLALGLVAVVGVSPVAASPANHAAHSASSLEADFETVDRWWNQQSLEAESATLALRAEETHSESTAWGVTVDELEVPETVPNDEDFEVEVEVGNPAGEEEVAVVSMRIRPEATGMALYAQSQGYGLSEDGWDSESYRVDAEMLPPGEYTVAIHSVKNGVVATAPLEITEA